MFSKSCQYAFQAILYIAMHSEHDSMVGLKEISESQDIPKHFLSKILQTLVKNKILKSIKGPNGGFGLNISPDKLSLYIIVEIIDGLFMFDQCGIGLKVCSDLCPCPIHQDYKLIKIKIKELLEKKTVTELCQDVKDNKSFVTYRIL